MYPERGGANGSGGKVTHRSTCPVEQVPRGMCPGGICHQSSVHLQLNSCLYSKIGQQAGRGAILGRELFQVYGYRKNGQFLARNPQRGYFGFLLLKGYFGFH